MKSPGLEVVVEVLRVAGTAPCGSRRSSLEGDSVTRQSERGLDDHAQKCEIQRHQLGHLHRHLWMGWAGAMVLRPVWRQGEGVTLENAEDVAIAKAIAERRPRGRSCALSRAGEHRSHVSVPISRTDVV